jgi:rhamnogalacturonan endolyase
VFSVTIGDVPNPQFQWFKGDEPIPGATDPTLTLTNVMPADAGAYHVVVTNDIYSTRSFDAILSLANVALVNHAPSLNSSDVDGSIQQRLGESVSLNGNTVITGDLLVPGLPTVVLNGNPTYGGTLDGTGAATPANYTVTVNRNVALGHVIRRTDPVPLPVVNAPPAPAGTRNVVLNNASQSVGDWNTVRNLTLNSNVGPVTVPPGNYRSFAANGGSSFVLGVEGATEPSVYAFQNITLNSQAGISVVGPVIVTLANGMNVNGGAVGATDHPEWLTLNVSAGGVTLNSGAGVFGYVSAPAGTVNVNGNCLLEGGLAADRLTVNSNGMLHLIGTE